MGQIWTPGNQVLLYVFLAWTLVWKGLAMWRAAKKGDKAWFIVFLIVNLLGIPEIIYLIVTKKDCCADGCCGKEEKK
jgi:methionyl-tRNA synthetase